MHRYKYVTALFDFFQGTERSDVRLRGYRGSIEAKIRRSWLDFRRLTLVVRFRRSFITFRSIIEREAYIVHYTRHVNPFRALKRCSVLKRGECRSQWSLSEGKKVWKILVGRTLTLFSRGKHIEGKGNTEECLMFVIFRSTAHFVRDNWDHRAIEFQ